MNTPIFERPLETTDPKPDLATAAPTIPPTRACDDELGRPRYQVSMFQKMAAMSADATRLLVTKVGSTMPLPMVLATAVVRKAPAKFRVADSRMAWRGERTRVDTTVAMALAASCMPLM